MIRRRDDRGATSAVELVIVAPALLLGLMMIVQGGLYFHARNVAEQAAQEGAATARAFDGTEVAATARAQNYLDSLASETLQNKSVTARRGPESATVTVTGTVMPLVPFLTLRVNQSATGPVERYVPPAAGGGG
jgi:Flp pilus assembly protein TadG